MEYQQGDLLSLNGTAYHYLVLKRPDSGFNGVRRYAVLELIQRERERQATPNIHEPVASMIEDSNKFTLVEHIDISGVENPKDLVSGGYPAIKNRMQPDEPYPGVHPLYGL